MQGAGADGLQPGGSQGNVRRAGEMIFSAKELGYDDAVIRRHESGRGNAKADTLQKYAEALNVNPESLLCAD